MLGDVLRYSCLDLLKMFEDGSKVGFFIDDDDLISFFHAVLEHSMHLSI